MRERRNLTDTGARKIIIPSRREEGRESHGQNENFENRERGDDD